MKNRIIIGSIPPLNVKRGRGGVKALLLRPVALWLCCSLTLLFFGTAALAGTVELPQTGQTKCYDTAGTEIACAGTGQDGDKKMGVAWASDVRFTAGTGAQADCVTDNLTGLMWVKSPDSTSRTWQAAIDYAKGLDLCGFTDWRVPSIIELESMVNADQSNSATWLNTQGFSNVQSNYYWSSTTPAYFTSIAWLVYVSHGGVSSGYKDGVFYVWPVRGGQ